MNNETFNNRHSFPGCRELCTTDLQMFTNIQVIGRDPMYSRDANLRNIIKHQPGVDASFLAYPQHDIHTDNITWFIPDYTTPPKRLSSLTGAEREQYAALKDKNIADYSRLAQSLPGSEGETIHNAIKDISDDLIYCSNGKVYAIGWGMKPDPDKYQSPGQLVHECFTAPEPEPPTPEPVEKTPEPEPPVPPVVPPVTPPVEPPKKKPWYKRKPWNWLIWVILAAIIALILALLLCKCDRDKDYDRDEIREKMAEYPDSVFDLGKIQAPDGRMIDDNGGIEPIVIGDDGQLPDNPYVAAPVYDDGVPAPIVEQPNAPSVVGNRLIIFLINDDGSLDRLAKDFKTAFPDDNHQIIGYDKYVKSLLVQVPDNERDALRESLPRQLQAQPILVFDEELYEYENTPSSGERKYADGWHIPAVQAPQAWKITQGSPVTIAVIDDGIDPSHPMLRGKITKPYNVFTQTAQLSQGEGHGTHTAGLAAGTTQFMGRAAGMAPAAKIMPIQVSDQEMIPLSAVVSGIMYALHNGAQVINMSLGPSYPGLDALPIEEQREIAHTRFLNAQQLWQRIMRIAAQKNALVVISAGNDNILASIPANNRTPKAITVGAVGPDLVPSDFTNYGDCLDVYAPGVKIVSSFPGGRLESMDGTSMAAPIVAGGLALMKSLNPNLTSEQAMQYIRQTGIPVQGQPQPFIQIARALQAMKGLPLSAPYQPIAPPAGYTNPGQAIDIIFDPGTGDYIANPGEGNVTNPGDAYVTNPGEGIVTDPSAGQNKDDIMRMIREHEQAIEELKRMLQ